MEKSTDHESKLAEVYSKLEDGDISVADALKQSTILNSEIIKKDAVDMVNQHTQQVFNHMDTLTAQDQWHKDYPDYQEFVESDQAQEYMQKNPILIDETIAYFQWKADQRFQEGKTENRPGTGTGTGTKEPAGADADKKYLDQNEIEVEQMRTIENMQDRRPRRRGPLGEDEVLQSQLDRLKVIRGES